MKLFDAFIKQYEVNRWHRKLLKWKENGGPSIYWKTQQFPGGKFSFGLGETVGKNEEGMADGKMNTMTKAKRLQLELL